MEEGGRPIGHFRSRSTYHVSPQTEITESVQSKGAANAISPSLRPKTVQKSEGVGISPKSVTIS